MSKIDKGEFTQAEIEAAVEAAVADLAAQRDAAVERAEKAEAAHKFAVERVGTLAQERQEFVAREHDLRARVVALEGSGRALIEEVSTTYKARNGRLCSIEADDGEMCVIVHADLVAALDDAICAATPAPATQAAADVIADPARELAELILSMGMATGRGIHARHLARRVLGIYDGHIENGKVAITTNGTTRFVPADEPVFLIRGQDIISGAAVRGWAVLAENEGASAKIVELAREQARQMDAWPKKKIADLPGERLDRASTGNPVEQDEPECCIACGKPFVDGDLYHFDAEGGCIHAECCGPERESYCNADGEPLGTDDPIPTPMVWRTGSGEGE